MKTTWSDWIPLEGFERSSLPDGTHVQFGNPSRFRVPINDDGWSDWISWNGGECPVPGQRVAYKLACGEVLENEADDLCWKHYTDSGGNIIAFKVQAAKPESAKQGPYYIVLKSSNEYQTLEAAIAAAKAYGDNALFSLEGETVCVTQLVATLPPAERRVVMVGVTA